MDDVRDFLRLPAENAPTGRGVRIGVVDTGVDQNHPDLAPALDLEKSVDVSDSRFGLRDMYQHGTHIAGIIAGRGLASDGAYRGIASDATIVAIKLSDDSGWKERSLLQAFRHALEANVDIINFSAGLSPRDLKKAPPPWVFGPSPRGDRLFDEIAERGVLCVVAAGNEGPGVGSINWPAGLPSVLAVGGVSAQSGRVVSDSSRGPYRHDPLGFPDGYACYDESFAEKNEAIITYMKPDVAAPGLHIMAPRSDDPYYKLSFAAAQALRVIASREPGSFGGRYIAETGTSMAAAVVSGLAACLLQYLRNAGLALGRREQGAILRSILEKAASRGGGYQAEEVGAGVLRWPAIVNAADALISARPRC